MTEHLFDSRESIRCDDGTVLSHDEAQRICEECPGYCCRSMHLLWTMDEIHALAQDMDPDGEFALMAECFEQVRHSIAVTCRKYDREAGVCTIHDKRPKVCRNYHCGCSSIPDEGRFK